MTTQKLNRDQLELVLRRAAELESTRKDAGSAADDDLSVRDLVRLGEEAGLSQDAIMRALSEVQRGTLPTKETTGLARSLGPGRIVISREVPGDVVTIQRSVEKFLRSQLMTVRRHHGERIEWEKAQGLWPGLARSLDFARRYAFGPVNRVETRIVPDSPGCASVTFDIDLTETRKHRLARVLLRGAAAFSVVGLGGAALFPGFGANDVIALFSGGAMAGGLFALERRRYDEIRERVQLAPERFLDLLVQKGNGSVTERELLGVPGTDEEL